MTPNDKSGKERAAGLLIGFVLLLTIQSLTASGIFLSLIDKKPENARPWTTFQYFSKYHNNDKVRKYFYLSHGGGLLLAGALVVIFFIPKKRSLYGDARWAKPSEVKKSPLLGDDGILLGRFNNRLLLLKGTLHTILAAPTRSGKGVGFVVPNLLNWAESAVVTDMKMENFKITSGFRKKHGQEVYLFNPVSREYKTHRWNPLSYIDTDPYLRIDDLGKVAEFLVPTPENADPMWTSEGRKALIGVMLYVMDTPDLPFTLGEIFRQLHTEKSTKEYFEEIIEQESERLDPLCVMYLSGFANMPDKQREGVKSTVTSALNIFSNPLVDAATAENDFDLRDLRKKKMTIYVGATPDNLTRMAPILRLFYQQTIDVNTREQPDDNPALKEKLFLLMDEFTNYGYMESVVKGSSYIAGYNIRLGIIIQDTAQLFDVYGEHKSKSLISNMAARIVYPPKDIEDAEKIEKTLGYMTVKSSSVSKAKGINFSDDKQKATQSISDQSRALLLAQEIIQQPSHVSFVLLENSPPIFCKKLYYWKDKEFEKRFYNIVEPSNNEGPAPVEIPAIEPKKHEVRGGNDFDIEIAAQSIPVTPQQKNISEEELDATVDNIFNELVSSTS